MTESKSIKSNEQESDDVNLSLRERAHGIFLSVASHAKSAANSTKDIAAHTADQVSSATKRTAILLGDVNGDGKVDEEDLKIAVAKGKVVIQSAADEVGAMAKGVARSELVRDVTSAAAVGAVIAVPIPLVGPMAGAVVGGTLGAYKNLKSPSSRRFEPVIPESGGAAPVPVYKDPDIYEKLIKFDDLRKKGILTDAEFEEQKKRLLAK